MYIFLSLLSMSLLHWLSYTFFVSLYITTAIHSLLSHLSFALTFLLAMTSSLILSASSSLFMAIIVTWIRHQKCPKWAVEEVQSQLETADLPEVNVRSGAAGSDSTRAHAHA